MLTVQFKGCGFSFLPVLFFWLVNPLTVFCQIVVCHKKIQTCWSLIGFWNQQNSPKKSEHLKVPFCNESCFNVRIRVFDRGRYRSWIITKFTELFICKLYCSSNVGFQLFDSIIKCLQMFPCFRPHARHFFWSVVLLFALINESLEYSKNTSFQLINYETVFLCISILHLNRFHLSWKTCVTDWNICVTVDIKNWIPRRALSRLLWCAHSENPPQYLHNVHCLFMFT